MTESPLVAKRGAPIWKRRSVWLMLYTALVLISHEVQRSSTSFTSAPEPFSLPASKAETLPVFLLRGAAQHGTTWSPILGEAAITAHEVPLSSTSQGPMPESVEALKDSLQQTLLSHMEHAGARSIHLIAEGGGCAWALAVAHRLPLSSLTLVDPDMPVEYVLTGNRFLNQSVLRMRALAWTIIAQGTPRFGAFPQWETARRHAWISVWEDEMNQRELLRAWKGPTAILTSDDAAPRAEAAALECLRITPQSNALTPQELNTWHSRVVLSPPSLIPSLERQQDAERPFDPASVPRPEGAVLWALLLLLAISTFGSEDLTLLGAGILVANGTLGLFTAAAACLTGIFVGDSLLYAAGRWVGRPLLDVAPFRYFIKPAQIERSTQWFAERGGMVIVLSRFTPGLRLPTYVACGILGLGFVRFAGWFLLAGVIWTPLVVWMCSLIAEQMLAWLDSYKAAAPLLLVTLIVGAFLVRKGLLPLLTHKGRRLALGAWRRFSRWEFWPMWRVYWPVWGSIVMEGFRRKHPTLFTACNPAIPASGFVGESKSDILEGFGKNHPSIARWDRIPETLSPAERIAFVHAFMAHHALHFPIVCKPDKGQRGQGVGIVKSEQELVSWLTSARGDSVIQEYIPGLEFGVFYIRHPSESCGSIVSITRKLPTIVTGDGKKSIERLILDDQRAVCQAPVHLRANAHQLDHVPAAGEQVRLTSLGTHALGSLFLDGNHLLTPALTQTIERISRDFSGFHLGRYDIRVPSEEDFCAGRNLRIVELNGLTSEPTHMYDPATPLKTARAILRKQWLTAIEIGAWNAQHGASTTPLYALWNMMRSAG